MSTSSSSSSATNNTGPSRFRGDAASFSPSQPAFYPFNPHQQYLPPQPLPHQHQPQLQHPQQQQHMYMQYAPPQYPVMMNQVAYPQMYMPVYNDAYYPNQYMVPQHQGPFNPNINNTNTPNYRPKNNYKRNSAYHPKHTSNYIPNNANYEDDTEKETPSPSTEDSSVGPASPVETRESYPPSHVKHQPAPLENSNEHSRSIETNSNNIKHNNNNETNEQPTNDLSKTNDDTLVSTPDSDPKRTQHNDNIPIESYPLFINTTRDVFENSQKVHEASINSWDLREQERLSDLPKLYGSKRVILNLTSENVINYKTGETTEVSNAEYATQPQIQVPERNGTTNPAEVATPPSTNWASFLKSSTPVAKKEAKKTAISSGTSTPTSTTNSASGSAAYNGSTTVSSIASDFNIKNESVQPLGILLLRVMFDPNYSITNHKNHLPSFKIAPRGLTNTGNICYMNSILQVLLYCQPFNKLLKLIEDKSIGSLGKVSATPLLDATLQFFNEFVVKGTDDTSKVTALSPDNFYMHLISHEKFSHLKWGQQEDAEEFLGYYLDGLNDEFLHTIKGLSTTVIDSLIQGYSNDNAGDIASIEKFKFDVKSTVKLIKEGGAKESPTSNETASSPSSDEWNEVGSNNKKISVKRTVEVEPTPITAIFGGSFKSVLTIPKNPTSNQFQKSITLDPYQHVQLDISEASSIEEALLNLNKLEKISYKMKDGKEILIKKQTFIDKLPSILIVHLKRFSFLKEKDVGIEKLRKKVEYPHKLHVSEEIISSKVGADESNQYRLTGVVYHHGSSAEGGHYTSDVLRDQADFATDESGDLKTEWIRIDDTQVKSVTGEEVLNGGVSENIKNAYILLYERLV